MKKILSLIIIGLIFSNILFINVFAGFQITNQSLYLKVNDGISYSGDIEVYPGDKVGILTSGQILGDIVNNVKIEYTFSDNNFSYNNSGLNVYLQGVLVGSNIDTNIFNPPIINSLPVSSVANSGEYINVAYTNIIIDKNFSNTVLTLSTKISSDEVASNNIPKNIYVNSVPHITDYYFEKSGINVTQITRGGGDSIDLVLKIKDYNGCENIDNGTVTADLSSLGLANNESLVFESCSSDIAKYKKAGITTLTLPKTLSYTYTNFSVIDESGNSNNPNDPLTSFDDEDKKTSINLDIVSAGTPEVNLVISDNYIGGTTNNNADIIFSGNQNGEYKIIVGDDSSCTTGNIITDWTTGYVASSNINININSSSLLDGKNSIYACLRNDESVIGSYNGFMTQDVTVPVISGVGVAPTNVITESSITDFICSENGTYQVEKGGDGTLNGGIVLGSGNIISNILNKFTINNSSIDVDSNDFYVYCLDNALNSSSQKITINKTTPPPSFLSETINFSDNDNDISGLDGRDLSVSWNNNNGVGYSFFESYRIYILPSATNLNSEIHNYIGIDAVATNTTFSGSILTTKDSVGNLFISGNNYKACISIMGSNGVLGEAGCSSDTILTYDTVMNPIIESAKFISSTVLEIKTNSILDTTLLNHDASLISFTSNGESFTGKSISSVNGKKINIAIDSIGLSDAVGTNLLSLTGAIRASIGGFNNNQSFSTITDGQKPLIYNFANKTTSIYPQYFSGSLDFSYTFGELMKNSYTNFEISRTSGNPDSKTYTPVISGLNLLVGNHTQTLDLNSIGLTNGTEYQFRIVGEDIAGNENKTSYITNINYDNAGPDIVKQNITDLYSTVNPILSWNSTTDNNGSGVKEYNIDIYSGLNCGGTIIQSASSSSLSYTTPSLGDVADYSWKVKAVDNLLNTGIESLCSNFRVDSSIPIFSNFSINDIDLGSTSYIKKGNNIVISSTLTDTNSDNIWLDVSSISGDSNNNNELCSTPSLGIACSYSGNVVRYSLLAGTNLTDSIKQVQFTAQNTSGGNKSIKILSTIADSNAPTVLNTFLINPSGVIGGTSVAINWNTSDISDAIGIDNIKLEYHIGEGSLNLISSGINNGTSSWNISGLASNTDYKIRLTATDLAGNNTFKDSASFEIDNSDPLVSSNTLLFPNGGEVLGGTGTIDISWDSSAISDPNLLSNPISISYSLDSGSTWIQIASNLTNTGSYIWTHGSINSNTVLIKITATDIIGNTSNDVSNSVFAIDTVLPIFSFDFVTTPISGSFINNSGFNVSGNGSDLNYNTSGYSFQDLISGKYFDGATFTGSTEIINIVCSDSINNGTNNSCDNLATNLTPSITDASNYKLIVYITDEAGNTITSSGQTYIGDTQNPDILISTGSGTYFKDNILLSGTSSDGGSGISSVKIQIKQGSDYWDGSSFVSSLQTLETTTSDLYNNWIYDFSYNGVNGPYEVTAIAYDKSFKINNNISTNITIYKDITVPVITGGTSFFTSPLLNDLYVGGDLVNISWNPSSISDNGSGLNASAIKLEYFNDPTWVLITEGELNDGSYIWNSASIDSSNVKIRLSAVDNVFNIGTQSSNSFIIDSTPPSISTVETMDLDADGQIDALNVIMSENIIDSSISLNDFSISNSVGTPNGFVTGNLANDNTFILKFSNIGDTSTTPTLSYIKGSLSDTAGKISNTQSGVLSIDKASARILNTEIFDIDSNGKFDKIVVTFSENIAGSTDVTAWTLDNLYNGASISSVSTSGNTAIILLNESDDFNTSIGGIVLNFNSNSNWLDLSNNQAGSISSSAIIDKASPVVYSAEYFDLDGDYKVDSVSLTFSENLSGFLDSDFSLTGLIKSGSSLSSNIINIDISETVSDNDTGTSADFTFNTGNLKDLDNNLVQNITNKTINDKVKPKLLSISINDVNGNGKIDSFLLEYSEGIANDFSGFISSITSYNVSSYSKLSSTGVLINVDELEVYDSGEIPLLQISSNSSLFDLSLNLVENLSSTISTDKVGPVIKSSRYVDTTNKIFIETSENIDSNDFIAGNFILNNAGSYSIDSVDYSEKSITLSGESIIYGLTEISYKGNSVRDSLGNKQISTFFTKITPPIIINELMLSNNSSNNYIELKNLSSSTVDISNYTIAGVTIPGGTTIVALGYYLISKDSESNSIISVTPNLIDGSLNISGTSLILNNGSYDIDAVSLSTGLGDINIPKSIERKDTVSNGLLASSWYTAQVSTGFDDNSSFGTPASSNVFDIVSPTIGAYFPTDDLLLAGGTLDLSINYIDNASGLGIDTSSDTIALYKWTGTVWGSDISTSFINLAGKTISSTNATYPVSGLAYGKYKADFKILDNAGNISTQTIIFYVDHFTLSLNTQGINIGDLLSGSDTFAFTQLVITVETVGAGFTLDMDKIGNLENNGIDIINWDGSTGFGYDIDNGGYSGNISSIGNSVELINQSKNINVDGNKNTYTYKVKFGANILSSQAPGLYFVQPTIKALLNY